MGLLAQRATLPMIIAIKNPAPLGPGLSRWGDCHFGASLQRALERRGITVVQHYWPEWNHEDEADVVLVLRGKRRYNPPRDKISMLWVLSHAASISAEELDGYSIVCLASDTLRRALEGTTRATLEVLRQCSDTELFSLPGNAGTRADILGRKGVIFVANSRNVRRDMAQWGMDVGLRPEIIGSGWNAFGLGSLVTRTHMGNEELPGLYRQARLSLNDHWGDMRYFGMINNRIFDCLASGLPVLSDEFPELKSVCGEGILYANNRREYWDAIWRCRLRYPEVMERLLRCRERLGSDYSFDTRAEQIEGLLVNPSLRKERNRNLVTVSVDWVLAFDTIAKDIVSRSREGRPRVFHIHPSVDGIRYLTTHDELDYLNGGVGFGPWEVALDVEATQLPDSRFDSLVVDSSMINDGLEVGQAKQLLGGLLRVLKAEGLLYIFDPMGSNACWTNASQILGLAVVAEGHGFKAFTRNSGDAGKCSDE